MDIVKSEYWSTPVWEIDTELGDEFNQLLLDELTVINKQNKLYNIWDFNTPAITKLKEKIFDCLDATVSEYFPTWNPYDPVLLAGWASATMPGQDLPLHAHDNCVLVSCYYVKVPPNSGDLLIVDPRGHVNWDWELEPGRISCIKYKRIKPKAGTLVIFPGYLMHSVETNKSNQMRLSVSCNIQNGNIPAGHVKKSTT